MNPTERFSLSVSVARSAIESLDRRVFLDVIPPTVLAAEFVFDAFPTRQTITLNFSEDVSGGPREEAITLRNLTTGQTVPENVFGVDFDQDTSVAGITFDGSLPFHALPDGNYRFTLAAGSVEDNAGNQLAAAFTFEFFAFAGDANRDRIVNIDDFAVVAANFNRDSRTFSQGDFDYTGRVDIADFALLAARFNTSLPAEPTGRIMIRAQFSRELIEATRLTETIV